MRRVAVLGHVARVPHVVMAVAVVVAVGPVVASVVARAVVRGRRPTAVVPVARRPAPTRPAAGHPAVSDAVVRAPVTIGPDTSRRITGHPHVTRAHLARRPIARVVVAVGPVAVDPGVPGARRLTPVAEREVALGGHVARHPNVAGARRDGPPIALRPVGAVVITLDPGIAVHRVVTPEARLITRVFIAPAPLVDVALALFEGLPVGLHGLAVVVLVGLDPLKAIARIVAPVALDPLAVDAVVALDPDEILGAFLDDDFLGASNVRDAGCIQGGEAKQRRHRPTRATNKCSHRCSPIPSSTRAAERPPSQCTQF